MGGFCRLVCKAPSLYCRCRLSALLVLSAPLRYNENMTAIIENFTVEFVLEEDAKAALGVDLMGGSMRGVEGAGVGVAFTCTAEQRQMVEQRLRDWGYAEIAVRRRPWEMRN